MEGNETDESPDISGAVQKIYSYNIKSLRADAIPPTAGKIPASETSSARAADEQDDKNYVFRF